jgi:hypothetical protein
MKYVLQGNPCSEIMLSTNPFYKDDIRSRALIKALGGEEWLRFWINADNFRPLWGIDDGLLFTFTTDPQKNPYSAKLMPQALYYAGLDIGKNEFIIRIIIEDGDLKDSIHSMVYERNHLIKRFENVANVTINF